MRRIALVSALVLMFALSAFAQVITDVPVPLGTPQFLDTLFSDDDAVCAATPGPAAAIHRWTGLPATPSLNITALTGPVAMASSWYRLDDHTAAYDTLGGGVAIVRGLPDQAIIVSTTLSAGSPLVAVNPTTAVRLQVTGFEIVRHNNAGATVTFIPSPTPLILTSSFGFGAVNTDTLVALGAGLDGLGGTVDDVVVRLNGLKGTPAAAVVATFARTVPTAPEGCVVTRSGAAVIWSTPSLSTFDVEFLSFVGSMTASTLTITVPAAFGHVFNGSWDARVRALSDNGVLLEYDDDLGTGRAVIREVNGVPTIADAWYYSNQFYSGEEILDDRTRVSYDFVSYVGFSQTRWLTTTSTLSAFSQDLCWSELAFAVPNSHVVAGFANGFVCSGPGVAGGALALDLLTPSGHSTAVWDFPNVPWARAVTPGFPFGGRLQVFAMGPGRVAGFADTQPPLFSPDLLRIVTFPVATTYEAPGKRLGSAVVATTMSSTTPSIAAPLTLTVTAPALANPTAQLGLSLARSSPLFLTPFDAILHLEIAQLLPLIPLNLAGPPAGPLIGSLVIPGGLPPALVGTPIYAQVAASVGGALELSDLLVIAYGL